MAVEIYPHQIQLKLKSRETSFTHTIPFIYQIVWQYYTEHGVITVVTFAFCKGSKRFGNYKISYGQTALSEINVLRVSFGGTSVIATRPGLHGCVHRMHRNGGDNRIDIRWKLSCGNVLALGNQLPKGFNMALSVSVGGSEFLAALVITHCSTQNHLSCFGVGFVGDPTITMDALDYGNSKPIFDLLCGVSFPSVTDFDVYGWHSLFLGRTRIIWFSEDVSILYYFHVCRQSDVGN